MNNSNILYIVEKLRDFWKKHNIEEIPSFCMPVGAATHHPFCIISALSKKEYNNMYINACIRHDDGSGYTNNSNNKAFHRYVQHYQFQVLWKNAPTNILELYKKSLEYIGIDFTKHSIKFIDSKWETLSMGAFGYGYEVYIDDLEITQFTYFQSVCDIKINTSFVEIAYGLERLAIALYDKKIFDINWSANIPYSVLRFNEEIQRNAVYAILPVDNRVNQYLQNIEILLSKNLYVPALLEWLKANDNFNEINAKKLLHETEKKQYMQILRQYAKQIGQLYYDELNI